MYWQWNALRSQRGRILQPNRRGGVYPAGHNDLDRRGLADCSLRRALSATGRRFLLSPLCRMRETLGIDAASILAAYTVRVSGYSEPLTVRMLTSASGSLTQTSEGTLTPLSFTRDGSYIVFRLDNGASILGVPCAGNLPYRLDHWRHCGRRRSRRGGRPDYRAKKKKKDLTSS